MNEIEEKSKNSIPESEAKTKWCSFVQISTVESGRYVSNRGILYDDCKCITKACIHWNVDYPRVEREDHSNAMQFMSDYAYKTGRSVKREGPQGCMGILYLEETGSCRRENHGR